MDEKQFEILIGKLDEIIKSIDKTNWYQFEMMNIEKGLKKDVYAIRKDDRIRRVSVRDTAITTE